MRACRPLLAALLLVVTFAPGVLQLGAAVWDGHSHHETLAAALVHGHDHPEGTPPHAHDLTPAPSARQDPPRGVQSPAFSPLRLGPPAQLALATAPLRGRPPAGPSGCGPPRLALLCSLLI